MTPPSNTTPSTPAGRVVVLGKKLVSRSHSPCAAPEPHGDRADHFALRAVCYGPFKPGRMDECVAADFATIRSLGFNAVRLYELPSDAVLAAAKTNALKLIVGIPWTDHVDFLRDKKQRRAIQATVRAAAQRFGHDDTIAALLVGNEIEKTLVRWMGPPQVKRFIESLIDIAHEAAPQCLVSYATYPSTEYLLPVNADFIAVNVYLEDRAVFEKYLLRLQNLAGHKPLVITEFGLDVAAHGEAKQAEVRQWFEQSCRRHGVAGSVWFSFTDEWFRGGEEVTQWRFGLVDGERKTREAAKLSPSPQPSPSERGGLLACPTEPISQPSPACDFVTPSIHAAPLSNPSLPGGEVQHDSALPTEARNPSLPGGDVQHDPALPMEARNPPLPWGEGRGEGSASHRQLRLSVVVCTRNGSATLRACLEALGQQTYPNHEILVIDDGSTDDVPAIAQSFPFVRYQRQEPAGLSVARNLGAQLATGDIVAYTDDDCVPDEDWLEQLALAFDDPQWVAAGGPNIPPPPRNRTEALVAHAPGGPSHVLLNDEEAEHLPGCNLAIRKATLKQIGGFNPIFKTAGDDVDVCWRLRDTGGKLRFCPGAVVLHHRRFTVQAYLHQQRGYGHAEAQLMKVHPQRFGPLGGARWRGLIYGEPGASLPPTEGSIFHGPYGSGAFQVIYSAGTGFWWWDWLGGVLWVALALLFLVLKLPLVSLALIAIAGLMAVRRMRGLRVTSWRDQALLWVLCLLQPIVREWARLRGMIKLGARPSFQPHLPDILPPSKPRKMSSRSQQVSFWNDQGLGREYLLVEIRKLMQQQGFLIREDDGWRWFDIEAYPQKKHSIGITTLTEYHGGNRRLTSVAIREREAWSYLMLLFANIGLLLALPDGIYWFLIKMPIGLLVAALMSWELFSFGYRSRRVLKIIHQAAQNLGLREVSARSRDIPVPKADRYPSVG